MVESQETVDVVVVGAGLSGVGAGYRLQTERPGTTYLILESREAMGGTWDLFRYPGVRSDSDMATLGYAFKPWLDGKTLADGPSILAYIQDTAREFGIEEHIRYSSKVVGAAFDTASALWTLTVEDPRDGSSRTVTSRFLYSCAGYYDYDNPHDPQLAGIEDFGGTVVHPQFWPEDLDYAGKDVVVIGSGATAVTIVPNLLRGDDAARHVTMLQRTPTWIGVVPTRDKAGDRLRALLPPEAAHKVNRIRKIAFQTAFYQYCRRRPEGAKKLLTGFATKVLGNPEIVAEHFTAPYDPWDQRLCAIPGADLFRKIKSGKAEVVTDHIETFTADGIRLKSGRELKADVVVTATGLRLRAFGGILPVVDGVPVDLSQQFVWNGAMLTGIPNFAVCMGYTNASWTLRADLTHRLVTKVLKWMDENDLASVVPEPQGPMAERPLLELSSGYVQRSIQAFPHQGDRRPWLVRQNYVLDSVHTLRTDLGQTLRTTPRAHQTAATSSAASR